MKKNILFILAAVFFVTTGFSQDNDGDGYDITVDCDDNNPNIHPGATEICDGIDNDCDGTIDLEFPLLGVACSVGIGQCSNVGVYICSGDGLSVTCSVAPGVPSPEICDGIDNNCDGQIDEGLYVDLDLDGFTGCQGDCDDSDPNVNPGMTEILCNGIDDDCNPLTLDDPIAPTASSPVTISVECGADVPAPDISVVTDAADNCGAIVTFVGDVSDGMSCPETITRTYNVADASGNNIDVIQLIIMNDITPPTASNPATINVECVGDIPTPDVLVVTDEADNCLVSPIVAFVSDVSDGMSCPETILRTYSVTDACGNTMLVTQTIVVNDLSAPILDVVVLPDLSSECEVTPTAPTATDDCDGVIIGTPDISFPITALGTTAITWSYTDLCGNTSVQSQDVIITPIDNSISVSAINGITLTATAVGAYTYEWLDCNVSNNPVGVNTQSYTPTVNGNYAVEISNGTCAVISNCIDVTVAGVDGQLIDYFYIYPNPSTNGVFTIHYDGMLKSMEIVDLQGRIIDVPIDYELGVIDASSLVSGKYFLNVSTGKSVFSKEIMIKK